MHPAGSRKMVSSNLWLLRGAPLALVVMVFTGACRDLTHVEYPDIVQPQANNDSLGALARRAGAVIEFASSFGSQALGSDLIADELSSVNGSMSGDQRIAPPVQGAGYPFDQLSSARINTLRAIESLRQYASSQSAQISELYSYVGYVDVFFAENLCSGVPVGLVANGVPTEGPTLSQSGLLREALSYFDSASASGTKSDSMLALATVGRARALLDSGDFAGANVAAQSVPITFAYATNFAGISGSVYQPNPLYVYNVFGAVFVSDREGQNGLDFVSGGDPRVVTTTLNGLPVPLNDTSATAPIVLASGVEAQLIQAEAQLHAANVTGSVATLDALRQQAISPSIPSIPADSFVTATGQDQVTFLFRERAFWLFLTGHRQGDLRRLIRQYGRQAETVFPTGLYEGGPKSYGTAVVYQPFGEALNAHYQGCLNLGA